MVPVLAAGLVVAGLLGVVLAVLAGLVAGVEPVGFATELLTGVVWLELELDGAL